MVSSAVTSVVKMVVAEAACVVVSVKSFVRCATSAVTISAIVGAVGVVVVVVD
jgi:hypothetical protein